MPKISHPIAEGFGQGLINFANQYAQRKAQEREQSRVKQLAERLANASEIEKQQLLFEADPSGKSYVQYELGREKNKQKQQTQEFIANQYAQDFGIPPPEPQEVQGTGLGGVQGREVQPVNAEAATATQPGFSPNAPQQAARNAIALRPNAPFNKNFNEQPVVGTPIAAPKQQPQQRPQQQLTPRQEAQRLRAKGGQLNAMQSGSGTPYLEQAKSIEKEEQSLREFDQKQEFEERKGNEKYRQELLKGIPVTKKLKGQLSKLETLNKKELLTPAAVKTLNFFGVPLGVFDTADEQEFEKQALDLTANIQQDYGSRILQSEFNTYLRRIPTLLNSKEGRTRIIENMKIYADAKEVEQKAYMDLYKMQKESGIKHPIVKQEDVLEYADKELDQIFGRLNQNLMEDTGTKEKAKLLPMIPQGSIRMSKDGRFYDFPAAQAELRRKEGFAPL